MVNSERLMYLSLTHTHTHTCIMYVKVWKQILFLMFLKEVSYANQACIYLIKNIVK